MGPPHYRHPLSRQEGVLLLVLLLPLPTGALALCFRPCFIWCVDFVRLLLAQRLAHTPLLSFQDLTQNCQVSSRPPSLGPDPFLRHTPNLICPPLGPQGVLLSHLHSQHSFLGTAAVFHVSLTLSQGQRQCEWASSYETRYSIPAALALPPHAHTRDTIGKSRSPLSPLDIGDSRRRFSSRFVHISMRYRLTVGAATTDGATSNVGLLMYKDRIDTLGTRAVPQMQCRCGIRMLCRLNERLHAKLGADAAGLAFDLEAQYGPCFRHSLDCPDTNEAGGSGPSLVAVPDHSSSTATTFHKIYKCG